MLQPQTMPTDAAGYRQLARRFLERPPAPHLASLAIPHYQKAIALAPDHLTTYFDLAYAYRELGEPAAAVACCEQALVRAPDSLAARFVRCMMQLAIIYRSQGEAEAARATYTAQLYELEDLVQRAPLPQLQSLVEVIGKHSPFYLLYQSRDDLELMRCHGRIVSHAMATCYPQWHQSLPVSPPADGAPIRVGVVSAVLYNQSIWHDVIRGWISQLDPKRFTLLGYHVGKTHDAATDEARGYFTRSGGRFVEGQKSLAEWAEIIRADQPHVLLYPDVNRRKRSSQLAALRLAPRQCTTLANYVTCGLPTMDHVLSGALLEPADGDAHYSEKLVRLANSSLHYSPVSVVPDASLSRADLGLRPEALVFFCGQTLFKYMPEHDSLYPRIAMVLLELGIDCQFVFLKGPLTEPLCKHFDQRLHQAFAAVGLDKARHALLLSKLNGPAYHRLNQLADLFLDSIGTGGANTTLEALAYDLPIVTWPGTYLRGRVSAGILRQIGVTETIAESLDDYVALAVRLARDGGARQAIRQQIAERKHLAYADPAPIADLARFLEDAAHGR